MTKKLLTAALAILFSLTTASNIYSAPPKSTPTATPGSQIEKSQIIEKVKEKIKQLRGTRDLNLTSTPSGSLAKIRLIAGEVRGILTNNINLQTKSGSATVKITPATKLVKTSAKGEVLSFQQIQVGDFLIAVGQTVRPLNLEAKLAIVQPKGKPKAAAFGIFGVVREISKNTLTIAHQTKPEKISTLIYDKSTKLTSKSTTSAQIDNLAVGKRIAAVGITQPDGSLLARRIFIAPGNLGAGIATKSATPSSRMFKTRT